jgi:hypothetical protein
MPRLSRKLRVCKWIGTIGCVLAVAAFVCSGWWTIGFGWVSREESAAVWIGCGLTSYLQRPRERWDTAEGYWARHQPPGWLSPHYPMVPAIVRSYSGHWQLFLPLWLPFLILLVPTLLLWRRDRRKPRPGFCRRCDYDLTGNTSGRCPECGTPIAP